MVFSPRINRFINLAAFIATAVINGLGAAGVFGYSQGEVSDNNRTYLTPAGWAFSIWGVIYFFQAFLLTWGPYCTLQTASTEEKLFATDGVYGWVFLLSCVCNSAWIVTFSQDTEVGMWISLVFICGLLGSLLTIYYRSILAIRESNGRKAEESFDAVTVYTLWIGFTLYTAWVTVATFLQLTIALQKSGVVYTQTTGIVTAVAVVVVYYIVAIPSLIRGSTLSAAGRSLPLQMKQVRPVLIRLLQRRGLLLVFLELPVSLA